MRNAMIIDAKDNVAVAIEPIAKGDTVTYTCGGEDVSLTALEDITYASGSAVAYGVTLTALPDETGNTHYEYITSADA